MVLPAKDWVISPGLIARPSGIFSQAGIKPTTLSGKIGLRAGGERAENGGRAAHIEFHFVHRPRRVLSEMPPVSKVTPLPTSASGALLPPPSCRNSMKRDGRALPLPTAHSARMPIFLILPSSITAARSFEPPREAFGGFAQKRRIAIVAGQFGQMQSPTHAESERFGEAAGRFGGGVALDDGDNGLAANRIGRRIGEMKTMPGARASDGDDIRPIPGGERRFGGQRKNNRARRIARRS